MVVLISGGVYMAYKSKDSGVTNAPQNDTIQARATPTPLPETPSIDSATNLYLEAQKLVPNEYSKDYAELKSEANDI